MLFGKGYNSPMKTPSFTFPHLTLGIDMLSGETSIPKGAARDVVNIDLDHAGNSQRRKGFVSSAVMPQAHSIWASPSGRGLFVCQGVTLMRGEPGSMASIATLRSADPLDYHEHNGNIYFTNRTTIGWLPAGDINVRPLGVRTPDVATVTPGPVGSLRPGRYTLAFTFVDERGEESGSSDYVFSSLTAPGGFTLTNIPAVPAGWSLRVYLSPPNGEELFLTAAVPPGMPTYLVGDGKQLRVLETAAMEPMRPGVIVRALAGRTYTALDNVLSFSESFRFGLTMRHHNTITMDAPITIVEPTTTGIFIGAGEAVWFVSGDPSKADIRRVNTAAAIARSSLLISGEHFDPKISQGQPVALWLSAAGYVAGLPDGSVVNLQADRIRIDQRNSGRTAFVLRDGHKQAVTPVVSQEAAYGTAIDSTS